MTIIYKIALILFLEPQSQNEYIIKYYPVAKVCEYLYGVPTSIQLAQALAESGGGVSYIGKHSNNHFGIKYYPEAFRGDCFTDRAGGEWRKYSTVIQGYFDHAFFWPSTINRQRLKIINFGRCYAATEQAITGSI